jgi:hypothetical protein
MSIGGGFGDALRQQIIVDVQGQGGDIIGDIERQLELLRNNLGAYQQMYNEGSISAQQWLGIQRAIGQESDSLSRTLDHLKQAQQSYLSTLAGGFNLANAWQDVTKRGIQTTQDATQATQGVARAQVDLNRVQAQSAGSADASTQAMMHWTRSVYFASQAVDDAQYGFRSIVNNLPLIGMSVSQALGGTSVVGMQVGAAVGIASVAINQFIPVVQNFVNQRPALQAFGRTFVETLNPFHVDQMKTSLESLNERIKELQGKKVRLAVEDFELDVSIRKAKELQKALEAAEEARTGRSKAERESGRAVEEILAEAPGGEPALFGRLAGQMAARDFAQHPEMRAIEAEEQKARNRVEYAKRQGTYDELVEQRFQQRMETLAEDRRKLRETVAKGAEAAMGDVFRRAKLGDIGAQQQLIGLTGGIGPAAVLGGPVGMPSLAAQIAGVSPAETRARLEHEEEIPKLHEDAETRKRIKAEADRAKEATATGQIQDIVTGFEPKLKDAMIERGAQLIKQGKTDKEIEASLKGFAAERLGVAGVEPKLIDVGAIGIADKGMQQLRAAIAGRTGAGRVAAADEILAADAEKRKRAEEAQAARERRRAAPTPEEREHQRAVEKLARENLPVAEGGAGQLREAVAAKVGMQMPEEQIYRQLIPQVAQRLRSRPTTIPPQMIAEVARQMVADEVAKIAPQVGAIGAGAVIGQQEQKNQAGMGRQQQAVQERGLAQMFAAQGATNQQALTMAHRTVNLMQHGLGMQAAALTAWNEMNHRLGQLEAQQQRLMQQQMRTRRRANLLNRGGPAG